MRPARIARRAAAALALGAAAAACRPADRTPPPLTVFAAADLRPALPEVVRAFRAAGGDSVALVFGATRALAAQIENGAPADAFLAADAGVIDDLAARGVVMDSTRAGYAVGRLAVVTACAPASDICPRLVLGDLAGPMIRALAIANPEHAPYGRAAREALERAGLWEAVRARVVIAPDVAQAYQLAVTGNADAALVAESLTRGEGGLPVSAVPDSLHAPLHQAGAVVAASRRPAAALAFVRFVAGPEGRAVLARWGFAPPAGAQPPTPAAPGGR